MRKGRLTKSIVFILFLVILIVFMSLFSFGLTIDKSEIRTFLKTELNNHFLNKPTVLNGSELRELFNLYVSSGDTKSIYDSALSAHVADVLKEKYPDDKEIKNDNLNVNKLLKKFGESCAHNNDVECETGRCARYVVGRPFVSLSKYKCGYLPKDGLKGSTESCGKDSECVSNKCKRSWCAGWGFCVSECA